MSLQGECSGWPNTNKTSRKCGTNLQIHPRGPLLNQPSTITWLESAMEAARKYSQKALTYYSWYFGASIRYWGHCLHSLFTDLNFFLFLSLSYIKIFSINFTYMLINKEMSFILYYKLFFFAEKWL